MQGNLPHDQRGLEFSLAIAPGATTTACSKFLRCWSGSSLGKSSPVLGSISPSHSSHPACALPRRLVGSRLGISHGRPCGNRPSPDCPGPSVRRSALPSCGQPYSRPSTTRLHCRSDLASTQLAQGSSGPWLREVGLFPHEPFAGLAESKPQTEPHRRG